MLKEQSRKRLSCQGMVRRLVSENRGFVGTWMGGRLEQDQGGPWKLGEGLWS